MDKEFKVGDHAYRAQRMSALDQYDVARKWSPLLVWLSAGSQELDPESFARGFCAVSTAIPKEDSDMVMGVCLSTVSRQMTGGAGFAPVRGPDGQLRFNDIELTDMLQIVFHVLQHNKLISFFTVPPATSRPGEGG